MINLPKQFIERMKLIVPTVKWDDILSSFSVEKKVAVRINTLKIDVLTVHNFLKDNQIEFSSTDWIENVFIIERKDTASEVFADLSEKGFVYIQNLSSMLVSIILNPLPNDRILDMCAAPGSKTSHMASIMNNNGSIVAIESVRDRFYKLKNVLNLLGVTNAQVLLKDARRFQPEELLFDKVLLDAPCSSESRFNVNNKKTYSYWSVRKIKEMRYKQKGLLAKAVNFVKPGGEIIYSTCSFAPEENEAVVDWILRKSQGSLSLVDLKAECKFGNVRFYDSVKMWENKTFNPEVEKTLRILPDDLMDGFFIAKFVKHQI